MKLMFLGGALMVLGLTGILVCTILRVHEHYRQTDIDYGIVLDAGSTATKAYIYEWAHKTTASLPQISLSLSHDGVPRTYKAKPGVASISPNSTSVSMYLEPILEWADSMIPEAKRATTPIYFQGTGGVRQMDPSTQGGLLASVRFKLQESGYLFDSTWASVLTGAQEAGYGFMAVNGLYSKFQFEDENDQTVYGSLDMGGTSTEIAFVSEDHPPENYTFTTDITELINGTSFTIYAQSLDGLGINEARYALNASLPRNNSINNRKTVKTQANLTKSDTAIDPCAPSGYWENATIVVNDKLTSVLLIGSSNYAECNSMVKTLVAQLTQGLPRPPFGDTTFVVADHYLDVKKFFNLKDNANILELEAKVSSFCSLDYGNALDHHKKFADKVQDYCFMGNYIVSLLRDYYGFDPTLRHILWKDTIHKSPVTWTLGSMIDAVEQIIPDTSNPTKTRLIRFFRTAGGTVTLFISVLLFILGLVLVILQRRRPSDYVPIR